MGMNDVNNDNVVDVKDVAQLVSDIVYKRTQSNLKYSQSDVVDAAYTAGIDSVLSGKYLVFVNTGYEIKDANEIIYTIDTNVLPVFTSSQGVTYVAIEHALGNLDENGNFINTRIMKRHMTYT